MSGLIDYRADGSSGTYINVRLDESAAWDTGSRTSLIVDAPTGRVPFTPTTRDHEPPYGTGPYDSYIDLDTDEPCFGDGLPQI